MDEETKDGIRRDSEAWHEGRCKTCLSEVKAGSALDLDNDYFYFCTNVECVHYSGEVKADLDRYPSWVTPD
jgi:hypothetical protein